MSARRVLKKAPAVPIKTPARSAPLVDLAVVSPRKMNVYLLAAKWDWTRLSCPGKLSRVYTCGDEALHLGLLFTCCSREQIDAHSAPDVSNPDARGMATVTFDFDHKNLAKFNSLQSQGMWPEGSHVRAYKLGAGFDGNRVHEAALEAARLGAYNHVLYRCGAVCGGGGCCCSCCCEPCRRCPDSVALGPSTCVGLSMRILARVVLDADVWMDDDAVFRALGIPRGSAQAPFCRPYWLTAFTPGQALAALQESGVVARRASFEGFGDVRAWDCEGVAGALLPLLMLRL